MAMIDTFGRTINYLRISVTDRCDFRCVYCMAEEMTFIPRAQLLTIEEISTIAAAFVGLGVEKIRITGGEPLVRRNIQQVFFNLGKLDGLDELTLTTNGSRLTHYADDLAKSGVRRVNISLDSLNKERFREMTRTGNLEQVLEGVQAARKAGLAVKFNAVILKNRNVDEVYDLIDYALGNNADISFIEEMPLGAISEHDRGEEFIASADLREYISQQYPLHPSTESTSKHSGPSQYWATPGSTSKIGFISPHSNNFCHLCNRVRLTATGKLLLCLGNEHSVDLRAIVRGYPNDKEKLQRTIIDALSIKPEKHEFSLDTPPDIVRFMNMTGG